jgi:hypothetical protein
MSAGTIAPGALRDVEIVTCWFLWPDRPAERKYLHRIDYEAAIAKEPWAWSLEPPKDPAPAQKPAEKSDPAGPKIAGRRRGLRPV